MIIDALLSLLFGLLNTVVGVLPSFSTPSGFGSTTCGGNSYTYAGTTACTADNVGRAFGIIQPWLNVSLLVTCLSFIVAGLGAVAVVKVAVWLYRLFPGKSA